MPNIVAQLDSKQVDLDVPYLTRDMFVDPASRMPLLTDSMRWRLIAGEPINKLAYRLITREISSLNWRIIPNDPKYNDAARYYTNVFSDFKPLVAKTLKCICILPQGGAWEIGWIKPGVFPDEGERGTVSFVKYIDAGTLHPTNPVTNPDTPIVQIDPRNHLRRVPFASDEILRFIAFPYDEWDREWWQESPTMASFMAIEALSRIYIYYLKQLRDTPVAGILDLMDFTKETTQQWAKSFREMLEGIDPIKIPLLYEHNTPAHWIPMGRNPAELSIQDQFRQYAEIVLGNYGLSLQDLRMFDRGQTKGGAAVNRQITTQSGISFYAETIKDGVQSLLPWYLRFEYTDPDLDEARNRAQIRAADARTIQTLTWLPINLRAKQAKEYGVLTVDYDPDELQKEFEQQQQEMLQNAQAVAGRGLPTPRPGQLVKGEGRTVNTVEEEAKRSASTSSRVFTKARHSIRDFAKSLIEKAVSNYVSRTSPDPISTDSAYGDRLARASIVFRNVMNKAFSTIGETKLTEELVGRLLDAAKSQLAKPVEVAAKSFSIDTLLKKDSPSEAEDRVEKLLDELLVDIEDLSIDDQEIADRLLEVYQLAYADGLLGAAQDIQQQIHADIPSVSPVVTLQFNVVSEEAKQFLESMTLDMVRHVNDGTKFFLKKLITEGAMQGMSTYDLTNLIREQLFSAPEGVETLSARRIRSIVNTELNKVDSQGRLSQMQYVGLKLKRWITRAVDVCPVCLRNEAQGSVPIDYVYEDVFGEGTTAPPAHPDTCHCSVAADDEELANLGTTPEYWTGE